MPASTVGAIEAQRRDVTVSRFAALLQACGWDLRVVNPRGQVVDGVQDGRLRDRAGRRYPAHLALRSTAEPGSWWGDRWVYYWGIPPRPAVTYSLRRRPYDRRVRGTAAKLVRVAAYAVVGDHGRVLLTRMSTQTPTPGWWTLPGGGLNHGEAPEDAVVREVAEETGLTVTCGNLLAVRSVHTPQGPGAVGDDVHAIQIVYRASCPDPGAALVPEADGSVDDAQWVPLHLLGALPLTDVVIPAVERAGLRPPDLSREGEPA